MQSCFWVSGFCLMKNPKKQLDARDALRTRPTIRRPRRQYTDTDARRKGKIGNMYPLATMRTSINV